MVAVSLSFHVVPYFLVFSFMANGNGVLAIVIVIKWPVRSVNGLFYSE